MPIKISGDRNLSGVGHNLLPRVPKKLTDDYYVRRAAEMAAARALRLRPVKQPKLWGLTPKEQAEHVAYRAAHPLPVKKP